MLEIFAADSGSGSGGAVMLVLIVMGFCVLCKKGTDAAANAAKDPNNWKKGAGWLWRLFK